MFRIPILVALSLCALAPVAAAEKQSCGPDLQKDMRLAKKLSLPGETVRLPQVVEQLSEAAEVDLLVQGDLLRRPVAIAVKNKTVAEVMENLALLFGGTWVRRKDSYLLITDAVTARLVAAYRANANTEQVKRALFNSLAPAQQRQLGQGVRLDWERFTPAQQRLALLILRDRFLREPERFPSSILLGKGVALVPSSVLIDRGDGSRAVPTNSFTVELATPAIEEDGTLIELYLATFWVK